MKYLKLKDTESNMTLVGIITNNHTPEEFLEATRENTGCDFIITDEEDIPDMMDSKEIEERYGVGTIITDF